ncbi:MAG: ribosome biogenesis GTPase Der [Gammaproteobacteria bacterium]|nr:ribosome biogenesis GTPase Der [Gammaproteobacteria bacterium]
MIPVIALVGRPNVGKSTLFNRLTGSRDALVEERPGVTRDRLYGLGRSSQRTYYVVDTGGVASAEADDIQKKLNNQVDAALEDCDAIVHVVDGRTGALPEDFDLANRIRRMTKPVFVAVNKSEGVSPEVACSEFQSLGLGQPWAVSALHGDRVAKLIEAVLSRVSDAGTERIPESMPYVAVVGRPNVGKSTLINALLRQNRVVVAEQPGTTRDSVKIPFRYDGDNYVLVDTAGMRRRARVQDKLESFSVLKTLQAIDQANVVIFMLDAQSGVSDQDATIAGLIEDSGRSVVLLVNKLDNLTAYQRKRMRLDIDRKLRFLHDIEPQWVSALHGTGLSRIIPAVRCAHHSAMKSFTTSELNRYLAEATAAVPPPTAGGRRIRLRYAHQGGRNPPTIVIHGNLVSRIPESYRRYLANYFRRHGGLTGTPVRVLFKQSGNPYRIMGKRPKVGAP